MFCPTHLKKSRTSNAIFSWPSRSVPQSLISHLPPQPFPRPRAPPVRLLHAPPLLNASAPPCLNWNLAVPDVITALAMLSKGTYVSLSYSKHLSSQRKNVSLVLPHCGFNVFLHSFSNPPPPDPLMFTPWTPAITHGSVIFKLSNHIPDSLILWLIVHCLPLQPHSINTEWDFISIWMTMQP